MRQLYFITFLICLTSITSCSSTKKSGGSSQLQHFYGVAYREGDETLFKNFGSEHPYILIAGAEKIEELLERAADSGDGDSDNVHYVSVDFRGRGERPDHNRERALQDVRVKSIKSLRLIEERPIINVEIIGLYDTPLKDDARYVLHLKINNSFQLTQYNYSGERDIVDEGIWKRTSTNEITLLPQNSAKSKIVLKMTVNSEGHLMELTPKSGAIKRLKDVIFKRLYI